MYESALSLGRFEKYFKERRLGEFYFPNGECLIGPAEGKISERHGPFHIEMDDLYRTITGWDENGNKELPLEDILGVMIFGDAVRYPGYRSRKKYWLFGEKINTEKQEKIQPSYADILIIAKKTEDYSPKILEPEIYSRDGIQITAGGIRPHIIDYTNYFHRFFKNSISECGNLDDGIMILECNNELIRDQSISNEFIPHTIAWKEDKNTKLYAGIDFIFN